MTRPFAACKRCNGSGVEPDTPCECDGEEPTCYITMEKEIEGDHSTTDALNGVRSCLEDALSKIDSLTDK